MNDWISVKERLPNIKDGETVTGFDGCDQEIITTKYHAFNYNNEYEYSFSSWGNRPLRLTHWRLCYKNPTI